MPLLDTTGNDSADAYGGGAAVVPNYIESVFSTYLYTGNGSTQSINNGIDLSTKGGLTWIKGRNYAIDHVLFDTNRGASNFLFSDSTSAAATYSSYGVTAFNSNGFSVGDTAGGGYGVNGNSASNTYVSWTFRKQPKFFDIVTYTGNGAGSNLISHNLGVQPGCIIFKVTSAAGYSWTTVHRGTNGYLNLNLTDAAAATYAAGIGNIGSGALVPCSATQIDVGPLVNDNGKTFVAYLFAHNAGGFGLTGTDNVISCGSLTVPASGNATVTLGYEPQWVLYKRTDSSSGGNWLILDNMRGMSNTSYAELYPNNSNAESASSTYSEIIPTATGFIGNTSTSGTAFINNATYIYIAIRRGPMAVPTDATKVFSPQTATYTSNQVVTTGFPVDMTLIKGRTITFGTIIYDRLRGLASTNTSPVDPQLITSDTSAETSGDYVNTANNTGYQISPGFSGFSSVNWNFQRAPSFFDEVCYTGNGITRDINHNLGVTPEFYIVKQRSGGTGLTGWVTGGTVYPNATDYYNPQLNTNDASSSTPNVWKTPTSTTFGIGTAYPNTNEWNKNGALYVAYLFATCPNVSKVGSYTGNGTTQAIACGFTGGARFVLIKRTDSTGDWYVYDTARGMTTSTDPYLLLDSTAAEVATLGSVTTTTGGFTVNASVLSAINTNAASYIFLAIS